MFLNPEIDLALIGSGSITAPAGHGKTEVIAASVVAHPGVRFLVLTHTNAGVSSLKQRVARYGGANSSYIETISALALRLVRSFPNNIGWNESENHIDYKEAILGATQILGRKTVRHAFTESYDRLIVDEYQDCTHAHDEFIKLLADVIPTVILGDPLQAIFDIDKTDPLVSWNGVVKHFPSKGVLPTPHRWISTNQDLGNWLNSIRDPLLARHLPIFLDPRVVTVCHLNRPASQGGLSPLLGGVGSTAIIIGDSSKSRTITTITKAYSQIGFQEHEAVQQDKVSSLCTVLSATADSASRIINVVDFLVSSMTGVRKVSGLNTVLKNLTKSGITGRSKALFAENVSLYLQDPTPFSLARVVDVVSTDPRCRTVRSEQVSILKRALVASHSDWSTLPVVARQIIDEESHIRHLHPHRLEVGSTLRVKGLEYDHVVLLDPGDVPSVEHLYVALSRATRKITVALGPNSQLGRWLTN